jgi:hypothetical protein
MDTTALASALVGAKAGELQIAVAAKLQRTNADQEASVAKLLETSQASAQRLANTAAGVGQQLDITV